MQPNTLVLDEWNVDAVGRDIAIRTLIFQKGNSDKIPNIVKRVTVEISYKNGKDTEKVELSTLLTAKEI